MVSARERPTIRVGSRESALAMWQTEAVIARLQQTFPDRDFQVVTIKTSGDKILNRPLAELGTRGVFVKELEEALLAGQVDLVVHSLKDLPTDMPASLSLAAVLHRADPRDAFVSKDHVPFNRLAPGARVATSSRRRTAQLRALRNDLHFVDIRGNVPTRLRKQDEGACEAMVLAAAGLLRLELGDRITEYLDPSLSTPAVGQGALAVECRQNDAALQEMLASIDDSAVRAETAAERALLHRLGGGCSVPIGGLCVTLPDGRLRLSACVATLDGSRIIRESAEGDASQPERLGESLAQSLLSRGADEILDSLKRSAPPPVSPP